MDRLIWDKAALNYYEGKLKELSDSPAWADIREKYGWDEEFMDSEEYQKFLEEENKKHEGIIR